MDSVRLGWVSKPTSLPFPGAAVLSSKPSSVKVPSGKTWNILQSRCVFSRFQQQHLIKVSRYSNVEERCAVFQIHFRKYTRGATSEQPLESEPSGAYALKHTWESVKNALEVFYRFSRPHTLVGTTLSIVSVSLLAVVNVSDISPLFFTGLFKALIAAFFMNIYIVGLNQLADIEIDKVNKPYLPLASGEYSIGTGVGIVTLCSIMSFWLGWVVGSVPLLWALFISFVLGTAYSIDLPFLRWKRFASLATVCIVSVRAVIILLAFYLHMQTSVFRRPADFPRSLLFATTVMSLFSVVIASFKDIPDIDGDSAFGIQSFAVRFGQKRVFWGCIALLELAYSVAIVVGMTSSCLWSKLIMVCGHAALGLLLWNQAKSIDLEDKAAVTSCYMFIWKLLYAEYLLIPLVR